MARTRSGSYRKSFFTPEQMRRWWPLLSLDLQTQLQRWQTGALSSAELTADFIVKIWKLAREDNWSNGPRTQRAQEQIINAESPLFWIQNFRLRGIPSVAQDILLDWHAGIIPLDLFLDVPTNDQVLDSQCEGRRCVSLLIKDEESFVNGGEDRDTFSFALHDLIHASHFYSDEVSFRQQLFFSKWMRNFSRHEKVRETSQADPYLREALHYLFSDMNSNWIHSIKCLKSILKPHDELQTLTFQSLQQTADANFEMDHYQKLWEALNTPKEDLIIRTEIDQLLWPQAQS